jgi:hypothetical protein
MTRTIPIIERKAPLPGYLDYHKREYMRTGRLIPRIDSARKIAESFEENDPFMAIIVKIIEGSRNGYYIYLCEMH